METFTLNELTRRASADLGRSPRTRSVRKAVDTQFTRITRHRFVPSAEVRDDQSLQHQQRIHNHSMSYPAGLAVRSAAHLADHPSWIADSWSAAALLGIPAFEEGQDACMISSYHGLSHPSTPLTARLTRPFPGMETAGRRAITAPQALIRCLKQLDYPWFVHPVPNLDDDTIRAVQVIDAFRLAGLTRDSAFAAAKHRYDQRKLTRLWNLSDPGAHSKPETTFRLIAQQVAVAFGLTLQSQFVLTSENGTIVTAFDLAIDELRIGLMYDGKHHWNQHHRTKDLAIGNESMRLGWAIIRVETNMLKNPSDVQRQIAALIRQRLADV